ncbi:cofactor-independent phosphoglycerate mutase [Natronospora cellulosivora (SeqCode)]
MNDKFLVLLIDGMADYPMEELNGKTVMEYANTPYIDQLAKKAEMGLVKTVPDGYPPGSDVANMSVLGYDPARYYTGRSPFEALSMGIELKENDVSLRCNLVNLKGEGDYASKIMWDHSAGEISSEEAKLIIDDCEKELGSDEFKFYSGISYRHLLVWRNGNKDIELTPPHDILEKNIKDHLPKGQQSKSLLGLMENSNELLREHSVNNDRKAKGDLEANSIWFWGEGVKPALTSFSDKYGINGSVISAVDLIKGLGLAAGLRPIEVAGATGRIDTNFTGKVEAAIESLRFGDDFVFLHIEAADEAGHQGDLETKIKAIEMVDDLVVKPISKEMKFFDGFSFMILPDHYTPVSIRTHVANPVPFMIYRNGNGSLEDKDQIFSENTARKADLYFPQGHKLIDYFIKA